MSYPKKAKPNRPRLYLEDYRDLLEHLRGPFDNRRPLNWQEVAKSLGYSNSRIYGKVREAKKSPEAYERSSFPDVLAEELFCHCLDVLETALTGMMNLGPYLEDSEISLRHLERFEQLTARLRKEYENEKLRLSKGAERKTRLV